MYEMYGQTVIHYKAATPAAFPANTATTATTATTVITAITTTTATTATGPPTDSPAVVTSVTAPFVAVPISLRKPLKNKLINGMIWHFHCGHPGKEAFESMVKRAIGDEIEASTTL